MASSCITMFLAAWPSNWQRNARSAEGQRQAEGREGRGEKGRESRGGDGSGPARPRPAPPLRPVQPRPPARPAAHLGAARALQHLLGEGDHVGAAARHLLGQQSLHRMPEARLSLRRAPCRHLAAPRPAPRPRYGERHGPERLGTRCGSSMPLLCAARCCPAVPPSAQC